MLGLAVILTGVGMVARPCEAEDKRLALLVGNQIGWKGDNPLDFVITGDLKPLKSALRRLGFKVKVLINKNAKQLRAALRKMAQRISKKSGYTVLFYYTGHSDNKYLHLGKRGEKPFGYKEFILTFRSFPALRRIAIFDSCFSGELIRKLGSLKKYLELKRNGKTKGMRRRVKIDLEKLLKKKGGFERGMRVIASSLGVSWELKSFKSSVFTHYLLQGLKGPADLNSDGVISIDELFDFTSLKVKRKTGQRPQQLIRVSREEHFVLAPVYRGRLRIDASVRGSLYISIANFSWSLAKRNNNEVRLAVMSGKGTIQLKKKGRCWIQKLDIPKERSVRLGSRWKPVKCARKGFTRKGSIHLPIRIYHPNPPKLPKPSKPKESWSLGLQGGAFGFGLFGLTPLPGGSVSIQHRFFGLTLSAWGTQQTYAKAEHALLQLALLVESGFRGRWGWFDLFAGGYIGIGMMMQDIYQNLRVGGLFRYGLKFIPGMWMTKRWGLTLHIDIGFALGQFGDSIQNTFVGSALLGFRFRI